ncbi:unnamed protein product [Eruca vesicaria subsp. sativa]|uniref:Uncharacterized protein n=1 Tax=Eruca vesicaria subsp. sativa TaxID=29727 RepID=A0ABC8IQ41_ERUVS|nr:unnamed protein product [Eruca vesicaria subsp. sativa]
MGVILDSWCFCKGVSKSEKMKGSIFSGKAPAMARISVSGPNGVTSGTGFLIHRNLLLTTHLNLPSISATETADVRLQNGVAAALFPHRFFITSSVIDLTIVGVDLVDGDSSSQSQTQQQTHYLKTCSKPNLELGSVVYLLGYAAQSELKIGEGKLVVATDNLIKLSTDEMVWSPGSAGFDVQGNLAFMICDPRKLATSPASTSTSSSSSLKKESNKTLMMQFGIPMPVICDWLNQHWEGSLDEHMTKPKLPLIRLMSSGQKSERSCASFTMRPVFKPTDSADVGTPSSSNARDQTHPSSEKGEEETSNNNPQGRTTTTTHAQGIPTPEIYESPKLTSSPLRKESSQQVHLLDINFPPRVPKVPTFLPQLNYPQSNHMVEEAEIASQGSDAQIASTGSVNGALSEVISSSPPPEPHYVYHNHGYSSEEETMYSAETAESRNYPTPPAKSHERVGRSQSCVSSSNRWGTPQKSLSGRRAMLEKQRSFVHGNKMLHSQGATSQRSNDYYSPTVSSIMKKRNNSTEKPIFKPVPRPRAASPSSQRWMF